MGIISIRGVALACGGPDHLGIDPDLPVLNPHGIALQAPARPSRGNVSIAKTERGKMARAKQPTVGDTAQAQVRLFMRTGPFTGKNPVAIANQQQIGGFQPHADNRLMRQAAQRADRDPFFVR
jgi:hypothetical protein